ncbi:hypothetical protein TPA0910_65110 [Streptomyces hygroscopicus subsp. sporocinereus]|uniref:Uncharacterized protein n=1 Tax=Streptomyces hygroscopicus TaxID=1912 RepID=A0ABQ3UA80_STRHY|nr:hypothetical protein TPA0910_65110 [Streptomyces hygroscopicus]
MLRLVGRLRAAGLVGARELLGWWGPYELRLVAPLRTAEAGGAPYALLGSRGPRAARLAGPYKLRLVGPLRLLRWWGALRAAGLVGARELLRLVGPTNC